MIKNITTLALAITLAAGSVSANTKVEQLFEQRTPEQTQRYVDLRDALGNLIHNATLYPAGKVKISKAEAIEGKKYLTILLDLFQYLEKNADTPLDELRMGAIERFEPFLERVDNAHRDLFEGTVIKLLVACIESLKDPIYRQMMVTHIKVLHTCLLAIAESDLAVIAEAVGVSQEVAHKTIEQLKAIEPQVERLTKLACDIGHNKAAEFHNQLIKETKGGFTRKSAIKYSSKLMEGYALARKFFNHAIKPWGGADLTGIRFTRNPQASNEEEKQHLRKTLGYFILVCNEMIAICDKVIAK